MAGELEPTGESPAHSVIKGIIQHKDNSVAIQALRVAQLMAMGRVEEALVQNEDTGTAIRQAHELRSAVGTFLDELDRLNAPLPTADFYAQRDAGLFTEQVDSETGEIRVTFVVEEQGIPRAILQPGLRRLEAPATQTEQPVNKPTTEAVHIQFAQAAAQEPERKTVVLEDLSGDREYDVLIAMSATNATRTGYRYNSLAEYVRDIAPSGRSLNSQNSLYYIARSKAIGKLRQAARFPEDVWPGRIRAISQSVEEDLGVRIPLPGIVDISSRSGNLLPFQMIARRYGISPRVIPNHEVNSGNLSPLQASETAGKTLPGIKEKPTRLEDLKAGAEENVLLGLAALNTDGTDFFYKHLTDYVKRTIQHDQYYPTVLANSSVDRRKACFKLRQANGLPESEWPEKVKEVVWAIRANLGNDIPIEGIIEIVNRQGNRHNGSVPAFSELAAKYHLKAQETQLDLPAQKSAMELPTLEKVGLEKPIFKTEHLAWLGRRMLDLELDQHQLLGLRTNRADLITIHGMVQRLGVDLSNPEFCQRVREESAALIRALKEDFNHVISTYYSQDGVDEDGVVMLSMLNEAAIEKLPNFFYGAIT